MSVSGTVPVGNATFNETIHLLDANGKELISVPIVGSVTPAVKVVPSILIGKMGDSHLRTSLSLARGVPSATFESYRMEGNEVQVLSCKPDSPTPSVMVFELDTFATNRAVVQSSIFLRFAENQGCEVEMKIVLVRD